jgi:hypothetical protein
LATNNFDVNNYGSMVEHLAPERRQLRSVGLPALTSASRRAASSIEDKWSAVVTGPLIPAGDVGHAEVHVGSQATIEADLPTAHIMAAFLVRKSRNPKTRFRRSGNQLRTAKSHARCRG